MRHRKRHRHRKAGHGVMHHSHNRKRRHRHPLGAFQRPRNRGGNHNSNPPRKCRHSRNHRRKHLIHLHSNKRRRKHRHNLNHNSKHSRLGLLRTLKQLNSKNRKLKRNSKGIMKHLPMTLLLRRQPHRHKVLFHRGLNNN